MSMFVKTALVVILALGLLLASVLPAYAQDNAILNGLCSGANFEITDNPSADCAGGSDDATANINNMIRTIINLLSAVVGVVAVVMIIFGGLRYITSGGNDTNVTSAKNTILYAIIGLIIVALAQILVRFTLRTISTS